MLQRVFAADMDHANGHAHHALGVIGTRLGQAADRHVGVADRLDLLYPELLRRRVKTREQPIEQSHDILRRQVGRKLGEAYQVGKGDRDVRETIGNPFLAAAQSVGDRRRQHVQQQFLVLAVLVFDHRVLFAQVRNHTVERRTELPDLVTCANRHAGLVVACGEAFNAGGKLPEWPEDCTRKPRGGGNQGEQCYPANHHQVSAQFINRREGFGAVDLGDNAPVDAGDRQRPPGRECRNAAVTDNLSSPLNPGDRSPGGGGLYALMQHGRAVALDCSYFLVG
ncbi:hypothetical protein D9M68_284490 [compost metagenome]